MSASLWLCADVRAIEARALTGRVSAALALLSTVGIASSRVTVWLRSLSTLDGGAALRLCRDCRETTQRTGAQLVVGERADLALLSDADGVHVTTHGPSARDTERYLLRVGAHELWLSAAVHDPFSARESARYCSALVASPFDNVPSKAPALGVAGLSAIVAAAPARATIALGGIDDDSLAARALSAGASGVAVRRALVSDAWEKSLVSVARALVA
ncbi:MAG: thiamine phosphate synthase [Myxococcales bacterium]|nr:thiamine phosphate synthase [Myxococcales bacterium]